MKEFKFKISGKEYEVSIDNVEENVVNLTVNGNHHVVELEKEAQATPVAKPTVVRPAVQAAPATTTSGGASVPIKSPLPGIILDIFVKEGDAVKAGQKILLLEAMKMENNIDADKDGIVKSIKVSKGDSVSEGDVLLMIE
ncbi:MAG: biotin/lipoyl-binding protein [Bacteroidales bacterium]|jgi:biotin carboxyl carrier protein|nr:biotin/lipoyl-binding protein [Bacteroidales bacterium]